MVDDQQSFHREQCLSSMNLIYNLLLEVHLRKTLGDSIVKYPFYSLNSWLFYPWGFLKGRDLQWEASYLHHALSSSEIYFLKKYLDERTLGCECNSDQGTSLWSTKQHYQLEFSCLIGIVKAHRGCLHLHTQLPQSSGHFARRLHVVRWQMGCPVFSWHRSLSWIPFFLELTLRVRASCSASMQLTFHQTSLSHNKLNRILHHRGTFWFPLCIDLTGFLIHYVLDLKSSAYLIFNNYKLLIFQIAI